MIIFAAIIQIKFNFQLKIIKMKHIAFVGILLCCITGSVTAQKMVKDKIDLSGRANDHLLIQYGYLGWTSTPDSINTGGFSNTLNVYFLFDFPFKTSPKLSAGIGVGVGSDRMKFEKTYVGIKDNTSTLYFNNQSSGNHYAKNKLTTTYLEAPIELRYTAKPLESSKSFKFAVGLKVGTLIKAQTRYKDLEDKDGGAINSYVLKESKKTFFNNTRVAATARIGFGPVSVFGSYQLTTLFKEGVAAPIKPFAVGLTVSGL